MRPKRLASCIVTPGVEGPQHQAQTTPASAVVEVPTSGLGEPLREV